MKHFRIKTFEEVQYGDDIARIKTILWENGYHSTPEQCAQLWQMYSGSVCVGWIQLPDDDDVIFKSIHNYMIEE